MELAARGLEVGAVGGLREDSLSGLGSESAEREPWHAAVALGERRWRSRPHARAALDCARGA